MVIRNAQVGDVPNPFRLGKAAAAALTLVLALVDGMKRIDRDSTDRPYAGFTVVRVKLPDASTGVLPRC